MKKLILFCGLSFLLCATAVMAQEDWELQNSENETLMIVKQDGEVGIGTVSPESKFHVVGSNDSGLRITVPGKSTTVRLHVTGDDYGFLELGGNTYLRGGPFSSSFRGKVSVKESASDDGYALDVEHNITPGFLEDGISIKLGTSDPNSGNNFIGFYRWDVTQYTGCGCIEGNGSYGVTYKTTGSDYAEWLPKLDLGEKMGPGDIVGLHGGKVSKRTEDAPKVMVISTAPIVLGNMPQEDEEHLYAKVAFLGQVDVRVQGPVNVGDFILPSGFNDGTGVAVSPEEMKTQDYARVVGRAWEVSSDAGLKLINCSVGIDYNDWVGVVENQQKQIDELTQRLEKLERLVESSSTEVGQVK